MRLREERFQALEKEIDNQNKEINLYKEAIVDDKAIQELLQKQVDDVLNKSSDIRNRISEAEKKLQNDACDFIKNNLNNRFNTLVARHYGQKNTVVSEAEDSEAEDSEESIDQVRAKLPNSNKLTKKQLNRIPEYDWHSNQICINQTFKTCTICYIDYQKEDKVKKLPCHHGYHTQCLDSWLEQDNSCPFCKTQIKFN